MVRSPSNRSERRRHREQVRELHARIAALENINDHLHQCLDDTIKTLKTAQNIIKKREKVEVYVQLWLRESTKSKYFVDNGFVLVDKIQLIRYNIFDDDKVRDTPLSKFDASLVVHFDPTSVSDRTIFKRLVCRPSAPFKPGRRVLAIAVTRRIA